MPSYTYRNKETKEEVIVEMKIAEMSKYEDDHPEMEHVYWDKCTVGDCVLLGIKKPPADFTKYVLGKIKARMPGSGNMLGKYQIDREI